MAKQKPTKDDTCNKQEGSHADVCMYDAALRFPCVCMPNSWSYKDDARKLNLKHLLVMILRKRIFGSFCMSQSTSLQVRS